ncbi:PrsW family intramembrane metalloprotease [Solihabitans fulvus]|uniref:PrsW family intramembrane metalloprotease n=1 Tax=Solihabitans fulvus TaxID=1892852 RepID=UPI001CB76759|nr:PrsW family intramembrane metalloprotease [Solihabitans fulvus]
MLAPLFGLIALGLCALVLLGLGTTKIGAVPVLVGAVAALVPVGPVIGAYLWVDRWEPEPAKLLLLAFVWGGSGAALSSLLFNSTAEVIGDLISSGNGNVVAAVFSAPLIEEAAKGAFLVGLLLWRRQEFDGMVDGIVYAGFTAAGFAFTENIYYFARVFSASGLGGMSSGVVALFLLRGVLGPFAHPMFTSMTGIGVGIAARTGNRKIAVLAPLLGYLGAVALHSLWNVSTTLGSGSTFINLYFLVMVPVFAGMVLLVVWQRRREQRVVAGQLPAMADHRWIAFSEVPLLSSLPGRRDWRRAVRRKSGEHAARAVAAYQVAATELAFLRHRIAEGGTAADLEQRHEQLLGALLAARSAAVHGRGGAHQAAPTRGVGGKRDNRSDQGGSRHLQ